jgi:hypothetical protein
VLHEANTLHDQWPRLPMPDKRKIVEALIEKIVIGDGKLDITYSCLPTSINNAKTNRG